MTIRNKNKMVAAPHRPHPWLPWREVRWRLPPQATAHGWWGQRWDGEGLPQAASPPSPEQRTAVTNKQTSLEGKLAELGSMATPLGSAPPGAWVAILTTPLHSEGKKTPKLLRKSSLLPCTFWQTRIMSEIFLNISSWLSSQDAEIFGRYVRLEDGEKHILCVILYQHINFQSKQPLLPGIKRKIFQTILKWYYKWLLFNESFQVHKNSYEHAWDRISTIFIRLMN